MKTALFNAYDAAGTAGGWLFEAICLLEDDEENAELRKEFQGYEATLTNIGNRLEDLERAIPSAYGT